MSDPNFRDDDAMYQNPELNNMRGLESKVDEMNGDTYRSFSDGMTAAVHDLPSGPMDFAGQWASISSLPQQDSWNTGSGLEKPSFGKGFEKPTLGKQLDQGFENHFKGMLSTTGAAQGTARPLKQASPYIAKHTSFISRSAPGVLLATICEVIGNFSDVDHTFIEAKNKIRGVARSGHSERATFVLKVFRHADDDLLVELQNRGGCVVAFNNFYHRLLAGLGCNHFVRRVTSPAGITESLDFLSCGRSDSPSLLSCPELPHLQTNPAEQLCEMRSLLQKLADEAMSQYIDSQRQALSALAQLTSTEENRCQLDVNCISVLRKALSSPDDMVQENACRFLVNVCSQETLREVVVKQLTAELFGVLDAPGSLESRASKRHVAKSFSILSSKPCHANLLKEVFAECSHYNDTLNRYSEYNDVSLCEHITATLAQIEAA